MQEDIRQLRGIENRCREFYFRYLTTPHRLLEHDRAFPFDILLNRTSTVTSFRINEVSHVVVFHSCSVAASRPISLPRWKSINPSTFNSWLSTTTFTAASGILPASGRCRTFSLLSPLKYFLLLFPLKFYGRFDNRQLHKRSISLISFRPESSGRLCSNRPWRVMPS